MSKEIRRFERNNGETVLIKPGPSSISDSKIGYNSKNIETNIPDGWEYWEAEIIDEIPHIGKPRPYKGAEKDLQTAFTSLIKWKYSSLFYFHVPNEGKHKPQYRRAQREAGVLAGVPDCWIIHRNEIYHPVTGAARVYPGIAIELKVKGGTLKEEQLKAIRKLNYLGFPAFVCWNRDEAELLVKTYLESPDLFFSVLGY